MARPNLPARYHLSEIHCARKVTVITLGFGWFNTKNYYSKSYGIGEKDINNLPTKYSFFRNHYLNVHMRGKMSHMSSVFENTNRPSTDRGED